MVSTKKQLSKHMRRTYKSKKSISKLIDYDTNILTQNDIIMEEYRIIKKYKMFYNKLKDNEKYAIMLYSINGYDDINKYLITKSITDISYHKLINFHSLFIGLGKYYSTISRTLQLMASISMEKLPQYINFYINKCIIDPINIITEIFSNRQIYKLTADDVLYRGLQMCMINKYKIDDIITFENFTSTSKNIDVALDFSMVNLNDAVTAKNQCICILTHMTNLPYIYIPRWSADYKNILSSTTKYGEFEILLQRNIRFKIVKKIIKNIPRIIPNTYTELDKIIKHTAADISDIPLPRDNNIPINAKIWQKIQIYILEYVDTLPIQPIGKYTCNNNMNVNIDFDAVNFKTKYNTAQSAFDTV